MIKYIEAFCPVDHYRCLMPIEYELVEESIKKKVYKKVTCVCHNVIEGKCTEGNSCDHFLNAEEVLNE